MMRAAFPPQEIISGIVVMTILPAVMGKVTLRGAPRFGQDFITRHLRALSRQAIDRDIIAADLNWNLTRTLNLKRLGLFSARLDAQWSNQALLAADQFAPVIFGRVRGFDEITGYGDNGASLILEYFTPWQKISRLGSLRALTFLDAANVKERTSQRNIDLLYTGIGARWQLRSCSAQCDLGSPLAAPEDTKTAPLIRFFMTVSW